ncbi:MAG: hypothetical protein WC360_02045 [Opitutales bacterium]|jgi:hypothetical protein
MKHSLHTHPETAQEREPQGSRAEGASDGTRRRGSALAAVFIICTAVAFVAASTMQISVGEQRLNADAAMLMEARNAAEAVVEYGFSELSKRFDSTMAFPSDILAPKPGNDPLVLPPDFYALFAGSHVVMPAAPYDPFQTWGSSATEIIGGTVPGGSWKFISGSTPGNEFDPLKDKMVLVREVLVYGKATVQDSRGKRLTAYCSEEFQIRDAPLFAHAIFYNMDMEIAPGPTMNIVGAVHANGKLYVQANDSLNFQKNVSSVGNLYHGPFPGIGKSVANGDVTFPDVNGNQLTMKKGSGWYDSTMTDWRSTCSQRWAGNVQDAAHGIQANNAVALPSYKRDNPATTAVDDALNYGYNMIMPLDYNGTVDRNIEKQKYAYQAGMYIVVNTNSSGAISGYTIRTTQRDAKGDIVYSGNTPVTTTLTYSGASAIINIRNYASTTNYSGVTTVSSGLYDKRRGEGVDILELNMGNLRAAIHRNDSAEWGVAPEEWWNGIVFVQWAYDSTDTAGPDGIRRAVDGTGLKLINAQASGTTPGIPDPANPNISAFAAPRGTTVATNNVLYVQGNYNADGNSATGSPTNPDVSSEPPAALAADSIVILSVNWNDANSAKGMSSRVASTQTEVSAAILTGLVPSDKNNNNAYSGGVENFPRFLEDWNTTLRYRGSMVALFESEVSRDIWGQSDVYDAPNRNWGFNTLFANGLYPPGTPNTRTYRRVNFHNLSEAEWATALAVLKTNSGF